MTNIMTLLAEAECWLGVEPLGEEQWAEVAELRERVLKALRPSCRECMGTGVVTRDIGLVGAAGIGHCDCVPTEKRTPDNNPFVRLVESGSEKEPLPQAAGAFLDAVAARRGLDGLE